MIEIIREEEVGNTRESRGLPKDIKQMGNPDIGDRIYIEDQVYQILHPYHSVQEKRAYVLLGKFENYAGKQCVFIEATICLEEMEYDGVVPLWSDQTWAYIYKQLKREYDSMVIVGWALDIKGQLPNMTMRLEKMHQSNFGGSHQVLFLMDSLEKEEAFYGNRNGQLYRREGFYVYYEKDAVLQQRQNKRSEAIPEKESVLRECIEWNGAEKEENELSSQVYEEDAHAWSLGIGDVGEEVHSAETIDMSNYQGETLDNGYRGNGLNRGVYRQNNATRGSYRESLRSSQGVMNGRTVDSEERRLIPSYASTLLLAAVVCALGVTAHLNNEKMKSMEETLARMNLTQVVEEETEYEGDAAQVSVETVAGNVSKQEVSTETTSDAASSAAVEDGAVGADTAGVQSGAVTTDETTVDEVSDSAATAEVAVAQDSTASTDGTTATDVSTAESASADASESEVAEVQSASVEETATAEASVVSSMTEAQTYLNQGYYIVQKGDSLVGICKRIYQTTAMMDKLCEVNEIEDENAIYAGQKLILPN